MSSVKLVPGHLGIRLLGEHEVGGAVQCAQTRVEMPKTEKLAAERLI